MTKFFVVIATFKIPNGVDANGDQAHFDSWTTYESYYDAHVEYTKNRERDDCYTTSICNIVTSTDYGV